MEKVSGSNILDIRVMDNLCIVELFKFVPEFVVIVDL